MADINGTSGNDLLYANAGGAAGTLILTVSGSSAEGVSPAFNLLINGVVVMANVIVTANHAAGATQQISIPASAGTTSVSIDYYNDVQADYTADRNLYISSVTLNGTTLPLSSGSYARTGGTTIAGQTDMNWGGQLTFSGSLVQAAASATAGTRGNLSIDAGAGLDTLVYQGLSSSYSVAAAAGGFTIQTSTFTDSLVGVERLAFDNNIHVALDVNGNAGMAYRLYQAAFDRAPDLPGLGFQMKALDDGWALSQIAQNFIDSPEFATTYGSVTDGQFVTLLYQNVLNREPEQAGFDYHVHNLQTTHTRADVLTGFSESPENQVNVIGAIQNGMQYII